MNNDTSGTYVQPQLILAHNQPAVPPPPSIIPHHSKTDSGSSSIGSKLSTNNYNGQTELPPKLPPQPQMAQYQQMRNNVAVAASAIDHYEPHKPSLPGYLAHLVIEQL